MFATQRTTETSVCAVVYVATQADAPVRLYCTRLGEDAGTVFRGDSLSDPYAASRFLTSNSLALLDVLIDERERGTDPAVPSSATSSIQQTTLNTLRTIKDNAGVVVSLLPPQARPRLRTVWRPSEMDGGAGGSARSSSTSAGEGAVDFYEVLGALGETERERAVDILAEVADETVQQALRRLARL